MSAALMILLKLLPVALIAIIAFNMLNMFVFTKYNPNKWIILGIGLAIIIIPNAINAVFNNTSFYGSIWQYLQLGIFLVFILWFIDLNRFEEKKTKKKITIKAKAKPNRAQIVNKKK